jgi:hypothetical protein
MKDVTYENFREIECEYMKYVSRVNGKFLLRIIIYSEFKRRLFKKFDEAQIEWFFNKFPYHLETDISEIDKVISVKLAIDDFEDIHLIEVNGDEYVLLDISSDYFDCWDFPKEIESQPIPFKKFMEIAFEDIALGATIDMIKNIEHNLENKNSEQEKYIELRSKGLYI